MKRMDVVIDLETLGVTPGAVIVEIGAALVPWENLVGEHCFGERCSVESGLAIGMHVEADCVQWWFDEAPASAFRDFGRGLGVDLERVLERFVDWLGNLKRVADVEELLVWGNGATMDLGLLAAAYRMAGQAMPWNEKYERDLRTALDPAVCRKRVERADVKEHRAVADAVREAKLLAQVLDRKWGAE